MSGEGSVGQAGRSGSAEGNAVEAQTEAHGEEEAAAKWAYPTS